MTKRIHRTLPALLMVATMVLAAGPVLAQSQSAGPAYASSQKETLNGGDAMIVELSLNGTQLGGDNETYYVILGPDQYQGVWHESNGCKGYQSQDEGSNSQEFGHCSDQQQRDANGDTQCLSLSTNPHQWMVPNQSCAPAAPAPQLS